MFKKFPSIYYYNWAGVHYVSPDPPPQNFAFVTVERISDHPDNQGVGKMPGSNPVTLDQVLMHHTSDQVKSAIQRLLESQL